MTAIATQDRPSYWLALKVLPADLVARANEILKVSTKVTFAPSHRPYNRSENLLPEDLVDKCRTALDKKGLEQGRIVLFGSNREYHGKKPHAEVLVELGFTRRVAADALGYNYITLKRWGVPEASGKRKPPAPLSEQKAVNAGFAQCQKVRPGSDNKREYCAAVGAALATLETDGLKAMVVRKLKAQAK